MELDKCDRDVGWATGLEYELSWPVPATMEHIVAALRNSLVWIEEDNERLFQLPRTSLMRKAILEAREWS